MLHTADYNISENGAWYEANWDILDKIEREVACWCMGKSYLWRQQKKIPHSKCSGQCNCGKGWNAGELAYYHGPNKQCMMFTSRDVNLTSLLTASANDLRKSVDRYIHKQNNPPPCPLSHNEYYMEHPYL